MIYPRQLTIQMRRRVLEDIYGNFVKYSGSSPSSLAPVPDLATYDWVDYTDFVQGIDKLELSWSTTETANGPVSEGQFVPKLGVSGTLTFERDAYDFLKSILIEDVAGPLNQVEVQITEPNGSYTGYVIKSSQLSWCEFNALCTYDLNLKQEDYFTQCIERTLIADNWQGWFQNNPTEIAPGVTKKHPRFSYCTEHRPNGIMVIEWYLLGILQIFGIVVAAVIAVIDVISLFINGLVSIINAIIVIVGGTSSGTLSFLPITNPLAVFTSIAQLYIESAGCGREHPAPLIRDYITNVCNKCGIKVNADTADIFFAPIIHIQKSDGLFYDEPNPHYNACLFFPQVKRGIRRYASINLLGTSSMDNSTYYDPNNSPLLALSDMLDLIKKAYNAQWRIIAQPSGTFGVDDYFLYFKRKDWFSNQTPLYDFGTSGADRSKLLEGICYEPTDYTLPASVSALYRDDPADKCGHENARNMNGDPLSFNNTINNPLFHGILDKTTGFGATKFRLDGSTTDYIYDALQVLSNNPLISIIGFAFISDVVGFINQFCDFSLLLGGETVSMPKIIIWDGKVNGGYGGASNAFLNARAIRDSIFIGASETSTGTEYHIGKTAFPGMVTGLGMPDQNTLYPQQINTVNPIPFPPPLVPSTVPQPLDWNFISIGGPLGTYQSYPPNTNVIGHSLVFTPPVPGKYTVRNILGTEITSNPAILVNYPMYFNPYYKDTLWDWFHWIDDPRKNPRLHKNFRLKIPLCKDDQVKLGLFGDGYAAQLLAAITLDNPYYNLGVITEINIGYDTTQSDVPGTGQYIEIKGFV